MTQNIGNNLTELETAIFELYHRVYEDKGFPKPSALVVTHRKQMDSGRVVFVSHEHVVAVPDGRLDIGDYGQFNVESLKYGASFYVDISLGRVNYLDIAVNGNQAWSGEESGWTICDPQTGAFS